MEIALYYAPIACSLVPYVTLTEAGADFEVRPVNTKKKHQMKPEYLAINPKHKVPVLMIDGVPLTENIAIQIWIARTFPKAKLLPSDPRQEIDAISLLSFFSSGIHPYLSRINTPSKCCDVAGTEDSVHRLAKKPLFDYFGIADNMLEGREYFFDHFTAADAYFFWCFRRGLLFDLDQGEFGNCMAHFERMKERASVQKVLAYEAEIQTEFAKAA